MIAKIDLIKLGRNCAVAITENGGTNTLTYVEDSSNIEIGYNQKNNTVTVTILGNVSATTKDITTGTYLTMDTGSGPVTITDYETFKTNYALLFLNGGSATLPTLDEVLNAGYIATTTPFIQLNDPSGTTQMGNLNFNATNNNSGNPNNSYLFPEYLQFQRFTGSNLDCNTYLTSNPTNTGSGVITNYLPETSGTLLNGNFNLNNLGLYLNYNDNVYTLGDNNTGEGLKVDNSIKFYKLGDDGNNGLFINNTAQNYFLGDYLNTKGLLIDINANTYALGVSNNTNLQINTFADLIFFNTGNLNFSGSTLQSGSSGGNSGQHLVITLNGQPYKIALQNP